MVTGRSQAKLLAAASYSSRGTKSRVFLPKVKVLRGALLPGDSVRAPPPESAAGASPTQKITVAGLEIDIPTPLCNGQTLVYWGLGNGSTAFHVLNTTVVPKLGQHAESLGEIAQ